MSPPNCTKPVEIHKSLNVDWDYQSYYANNNKPAIHPLKSDCFTKEMQVYLHDFIRAHKLEDRAESFSEKEWASIARNLDRLAFQATTSELNSHTPYTWVQARDEIMSNKAYYLGIGGNRILPSPQMDINEDRRSSGDGGNGTGKGER